MMTDTKATLLILSVPDPTTPLTEISSIYLETIKSALHTVQSQLSTSLISSRLHIAVATPLTDSTGPSRTSVYDTFQHLLSSIYSLVGTAAVQAQCDLDYPRGVDVRVFVVTPDSAAPSNDVLSGPVVQQSTLARCLSTRYTQILMPDESTAKRLTEALRGSITDTQTLPVGPDAETFTHRPAPPRTNQSPSAHHKKVAVGGTFDHIHLGHKLLLTSTIFLASPVGTSANNDGSSSSSSREITIGITGDSLLVNKKHAAELESWETRQQRCEDFVQSILCFHPDPDQIKTTEKRNDPGPNGKVVAVTYSTPGSAPRTSHTTAAVNNHTTDRITINYTCITDPFGPTITDQSITAIIVSGETRAGGNAVNEKRRDKGWKELEVFEIEVLDSSIASAGGSTGFEGKISSTEIRRRLAEDRQTQT